MPLSPGTSLGPYKILAPLGAGGMGEVYRAHDTRLGRDVAIKVLSPHLAAAPEVRARFEREARTISQLNHPHICTLYDVGHQDGVDYLVMELLEGETLAHRLEKGPLPVAEVLTVGTQIADALDRAHRAGVVHRDLKPGNVILTKGGAKLMDFGLARAAGLTPVAGTLTESPTVSRPLTAEGTIVGTFQYMAPEQLEGKEADARADLWALGCVLYEMATGQRAFEGKSQASLIAAIMEREPRPILELQPMSPPALEHLTRRCVAKDPAERWQSARDVMHELKWIAEIGSQAGVPAGHPPEAGRAARRRHRERLAWGGVVAAMAVAIVALAVIRWTRRLPEPGLARFAVTAPAGGTIATDAAQVAISPDGRRLVFAVVDSAGTPRLWIRPLNFFSAQPLPGTENAFYPFWSPDSRFVAFFAEGKLRKVPVGGGPPEVICDAPNGRGGSWSKDGVIVFAPLAMGPLLRVSADGGEVTEVARPDSGRHETGLRSPCFLPDGSHFLYVSLPRRQAEFDVYLGALGSKEHRRIMAAGSAPIFAEPGYLLFARGGRLVAQRFDRFRSRPAGKALPIGDEAPLSSFEGASLLSASASGVLVHAESSPPNTRLVWLDRAGRPAGTVPLPPGCYEYPSLSPDGRRAMVTRPNSPNSTDIWMVDLPRAVITRLTFDGLVAAELAGVWSPDGSRIAFQYNRSGPYDVYQMCTSGAGGPEPLVQSSVVLKVPGAYSPDGRYLVFAQNDEATGWDLWLLPLGGNRKPVPYLRTPFNEITAAISPDGHWLAYDSDETGSQEIYVRSFPEPGEKYRVTTSGGTAAEWSRDGRELLIWTGAQLPLTNGPVFSVDVETIPSFRAGTPRLLFTPRQDLVGLAVTRDHMRFLAAVPVEGAAPPSITVVMNWQAALKR
jgi:Tol biopolymer transport system component